MTNPVLSPEACEELWWHLRAHEHPDGPITGAGTHLVGGKTVWLKWSQPPQRIPPFTENDLGDRAHIVNDTIAIVCQLKPRGTTGYETRLAFFVLEGDRWEPADEGTVLLIYLSLVG